MSAFFSWLGKLLLQFLWGKAQERIAEDVQEKKDSARDEKNKLEAVEELRKPAANAKEKEDAFKKFFARFKR